MSDEVEIHFDRFQAKEPKLAVSFYSIYQNRLEVLAPTFRSRLPEPVRPRISELVMHERCSFIGFLEKEAENRHSSLQQSAHTENDKLFIVDPTSRIALTGNIKPNRYTTGVVIGVTGTLESPSTFNVIDTYEPLFAEPDTVICDRPMKIAFVSNLMLNSDMFDCRSGYNLVELINQDSNIELLIVIGSTIGPIEDSCEQGWVRNMSIVEISPLQMLERYLDEFRCRKMIIPGEYDPVDNEWPQQPFHPCLVSDVENLMPVTNPCSFSVGELSFLCCDGRNVRDLTRETSMGFHEAQLSLLNWRLLAPTAPATLPYVSSNTDKLIVDSIPNVFVCGGSENLIWNELSGVVLISLPDFTKTRTAAVFNLQTGEVEELTC